MKILLTTALGAAAMLSLAAPACAKEAAVLTDTAWTGAPSFSAVAAAYPAAAKAQGKSGNVMLNCVFGADGRLHGCDVLSESPGGFGFAAAAKGLAHLFQGPTELDNGRSIAGAQAQIQFRFTPDLADNPTVTHPEWVLMPTPAAFQAAFPDSATKAGVLKARAVMSCTVDSTGGLTDCRKEGENPEGYGFGDATLPLASAFRLKAWGADGRPVVGGRVRVPIRYELQQVAAPAAAKP